VRMSGRHEPKPYLYCPPGEFFYVPEIYFCDYFYDNLLDYYVLNNNNTELSSYDGYLIYGDDTESGIITLGNKAAYLEQPINAKKEYSATAWYADKNLKDIVLFSGNNELHIKRLSDDELLWRILHTGKLNIYDDRCAFPSYDNVHESHLKVVYGQQGRAIEIRNRKELTDAINTAYGTHLRAKDYSWKQLLAYIDTLD
jgi:hypothetical protein